LDFSRLVPEQNLADIAKIDPSVRDRLAVVKSHEEIGDFCRRGNPQDFQSSDLFQLMTGDDIKL
jgi:hypothetical protein